MTAQSKYSVFDLKRRVPRGSSLTRNSERGSSLVEMAILLPFLLLILIGVIDFGRAYYDSIEVANAARAGAQYGVINPTDTTGMVAAAKSDTSVDIPTITATAAYGCMCSDGTGASPTCSTTPSCSSSTRQVNYVQVNTSYTYTTFFPWPGVPASFPLTGKAIFSAGE
jgi:Flp pilus assembly protein TadG